ASDEAAIGMVDDPYRQQQYPLVLSQEHHNIVVFGAPGSGKSSALQMIAQVNSERQNRCLWLDAHDTESTVERLRMLRGGSDNLVEPSDSAVDDTQHTMVLIDDFEQFRDAYELSLSGSLIYQQLIELVTMGKQWRC